MCVYANAVPRTSAPPSLQQQYDHCEFDRMFRDLGCISRLQIEILLGSSGRKIEGRPLRIGQLSTLRKLVQPPSVRKQPKSQRSRHRLQYWHTTHPRSLRHRHLNRMSKRIDLQRHRFVVHWTHRSSKPLARTCAEPNARSCVGRK